LTNDCSIKSTAVKSLNPHFSINDNSMGAYLMTRNQPPIPQPQTQIFGKGLMITDDFQRKVCLF